MLKSLGFVRHPDKKLAAPLVGGGRRRWCSGVCFTGGVWGGYPSGSSLVVSSWWGRKRLGGGIGVSGFLRMRAAAMRIMVSYSRFSVTSSSAYRCSSLRSVAGLRLG